MKLVLAEKPSVAQSIAKVLGAAKREDGYLEGNGYVVSWCVGHLVELAQPEVYDAKYSKWAYQRYPLPQHLHVLRIPESCRPAKPLPAEPVAGNSRQLRCAAFSWLYGSADS